MRFKLVLSVMSALCLVALPASAAAAASPAAGSSVSASQWSATHGTASATGSSEWTPVVPPLSGQMTLEGELTNTGADCYFVRLTVSLDLVPWSVGTPVQCGPGSLPVDLTLGTTWVTWSASVDVCRGEPGQGGGLYPPAIDCGPRVPLPR